MHMRAFEVVAQLVLKLVILNLKCALQYVRVVVFAMMVMFVNLLHLEVHVLSVKLAIKRRIIWSVVYMKNFELVVQLASKLVITNLKYVPNSVSLVAFAHAMAIFVMIRVKIVHALNVNSVFEMYCDHL